MTEFKHLQQAMRLIKEERKRQIEVEGYTPEHDDKWNSPHDLISGAYTYQMDPVEREEYPFSWPWAMKHWKPTAKEGVKGRIRELVKAGALYMAAKEQLERVKGSKTIHEATCIRVDMVAESIAGLLKQEHESVLSSSEA